MNQPSWVVFIKRMNNSLQDGLQDFIAVDPRTAKEGPFEGLTTKHWKDDLAAGLVVFLVALPLCLGIALASAGPDRLFAGIIAGVIGGIVVGALSSSHISVSGPAAGLAVIVFGAIQSLNSFPKFQLALVIAGVIQLVFTKIRFGALANFVPHSVIKGMLAGIGIVIVMKQIPHALGRDKDYEGDFSFLEAGENTSLSEIAAAVASASPGAILISALGLALLILWDTKKFKSFSFTKLLPGPLVAVVAGAGLNELLRAVAPKLAMTEKQHLVDLPVFQSVQQLSAAFQLPDFSAINQQAVWSVGLTIAIVASLESLLSLDAADKLDPQRRFSSPDRELMAQGVGNTLCGLVGGLPITSVVVRSSANAYSGAKTKLSTIVHGGFLLVAVLAIPAVLNRIPLACLAAVLLTVGYKLASPKLFKSIYAEGRTQFLPFVLTLAGVVFIDLLKGVIVGLVVGLYYVLKTNYHNGLTVVNDGDYYLIRINKDLSFLNKTELKDKILALPNNCTVLIKGREGLFIDHDIFEVIEDFKAGGDARGISVVIEDVYVSSVLSRTSRKKRLAEAGNSTQH